MHFRNKIAGRFITCLLFGTVTVFNGPKTYAGYMHTSGTQLLDREGKHLLLRGVNLGNWLYMEPWMIGNTPLPMFQDETGKVDEFRTRSEKLVGVDRTAMFYAAWRDNYVTAKDIKDIRTLGFNSIRVPIDYLLFENRDGAGVGTGFHYLDRLVKWCAESKIYVIPDMHNIPGGKIGWVKGTIYDDPTKQDRIVSVWQRIAKHYKSETWIGGYDLINEPAVWNGAKLGPLYKKIGQAIRKVDPNHLLILEGDAWGSRVDLAGLAEPADVWDHNLMLSNHAYGTVQTDANDQSKSSIKDSLYSQKSLAGHLQVPLWMGEFGYNSNVWLAREKALCESFVHTEDLTAKVNEGWCLWAYKSSGIWSIKRYETPSSYHVVQKYFGAKPGSSDHALSPEEGWRGLSDLTRSVSYNQCRYNRDVVDALTRGTFFTASKQYRSGLSIPGMLSAVDYDMGADGIAYHDMVSTDEAGKGPAGRAWNAGWNFRNDGVDVYPVNGQSGRFAIGNVEPGEWVQYTVSTVPGRYRISVRYSSPTGSQLHLTLNGTPIGPSLVLPKTAGWGDYSTFSTAPVSVSPRKQGKLRIYFDAPGLSLQSVRFAR